MASGHAHRTASRLLALPVALAALVITKDYATALGAGLGCYAGIAIHPDLDLTETRMPIPMKVVSLLAWTVAIALALWALQ